MNALAGGLPVNSAFSWLPPARCSVVCDPYRGQSSLLACVRHFFRRAALDRFISGVAAVTLAVNPPHSLASPDCFGKDIYARREISQILNVPASLLIALAITIFAYIVMTPLLAATTGPYEKINLPIGAAALFLGAYTIVVRREAVPQVIGILDMENGAFFDGVSIAPNLPLIAELAAAFDVLIIALVMGILTRKIHEQVGTTAVGEMISLREE